MLLHKLTILAKLRLFIANKCYCTECKLHKLRHWAFAAAAATATASSTAAAAATSDSCSAKIKFKRNKLHTTVMHWNGVGNYWFFFWFDTQWMNEITTVYTHCANAIVCAAHEIPNYVCVCVTAIKYVQVKQNTRNCLTVLLVSDFTRLAYVIAYSCFIFLFFNVQNLHVCLQNGIFCEILSSKNRNVQIVSHIKPNDVRLAGVRITPVLGWFEMQLHLIISHSTVKFLMWNR